MTTLRAIIALVIVLTAAGDVYAVDAVSVVEEVKHAVLVITGTRADNGA